MATSLPNVVTRFASRLSRNGCAEYAKRVLLRLPLLAFIVVCVFDPADKVLGIKVWLFVALWAATCVVGLLASDEISLPAGLLLSVLLFITIPMLSILWYYLSDGTLPYAGFGLLKSYLLVSLAVVLVINRVDVIPFLSGVLSVLALLTIAIFVVLLWRPELFLHLYFIGQESGVFLVGHRDYGHGLSFTQVMFATAPMLAISIPHYFDRAVNEPCGKSKLAYLALTAISIIGMLLVGLRNTMAIALLLPLLLWPLYTRRVVVNELISLGALTILCLPFIGKMKAFLDPAEVSNSVKLTFLGDYAKIFSDPTTLLFGKGLGAYYRWSSSGQPDFVETGMNYYFISELTYAEMIRWFGLVGAAIMMALLLLPVAQVFLVSKNRRRRGLAVGYLTYLGMSATNPTLFSSLGMLIFSALLANSFQASDVGESRSPQSGPQ